MLGQEWVYNLEVDLDLVLERYSAKVLAHQKGEEWVERLEEGMVVAWGPWRAIESAQRMVEVMEVASEPLKAGG